MTEPVIAQRFPYELELEAGRYWWCACGKSKNQPFCDGSHQGGEFTPVEFTLQEKTRVFLCGCKHTRSKPYCNGAHKKL